ncbi:MAG: hypothetical protein AAGI07_00280 [Bacteroidota bacterium]
MSKVVGKEIVNVDSSTISTLQVPNSALGCYISFDADPTSTHPLKAARFWQNGDTPTSSQGALMGDNGYYEICGRANMEHFKIIGIETSKSHRLMIEYYA